MNRKDLISFTMDAMRYVIETGEEIRGIILFGSIARGDFDSESDIDVFIDIPKAKKSAEHNIQKGIKIFLNSQTNKNWKRKGIEKDISLFIGNLKSKEWTSLRRSIISNGIVLFGKYIEKPEGVKQSVMFSYEKIKNSKKRVTLYRKLFGYSVSGKHYNGLIKKTNGKKIGPGVFIVPTEDAKSVSSIFKKMKIPYRIYEIWLD